MSFEIDLNSYLWSFDSAQPNCAAEIKANAEKAENVIDFFSSHRSSSSSDSNRHMLKQYGASPVIQMICQCLDNDLSRIIDDIEFSTALNANSISSLSYVTILNDDFKHFNEYLHAHLLAFSDNVCRLLNEQANACTSEYERGARQENSVNKMLLICRLAYSLPKFSHNLKLCFNNSNLQLINQRQQLTSKLLSSSGGVGSIKESSSSLSVDGFKKLAVSKDFKSLNTNPDWLKFMSTLRSICKSCIDFWIKHLCHDMEEKYLKRYILKPNDVLLVDELIAWDEIEVDEELDDLSKDSSKSKLNAPLVCSPLVQTILYAVSQSLARSLPYTMIDSHLVLKDLTIELFSCLLRSLRRLATDNDGTDLSDRLKLTQNQALQIIFDLKYLFTLFDFKSYATSNENEKVKLSRMLDDYQSVTSQFESMIDPFDYDICLPFIQSNINKCITRSNVRLSSFLRFFYY